MSKETGILPRWRVLLNEIITKWHMLRPAEREIVTRLDYYNGDETPIGVEDLDDIASRLGMN